MEESENTLDDFDRHQNQSEEPEEKRGRGRPRTAKDGNLRKSRLSVICTKEELDRYNTVANNYGYTASQFAHKLFQMVELVMPKPYEINRNLDNPLLGMKLRNLFEYREIDIISVHYNSKTRNRNISGEEQKESTEKRKDNALKALNCRKKEY